MSKHLARHVALAMILAIGMPACGGSSPSAPTTTTPTTLPPRDGVIVLNGAIGGRFKLSSSPARLSRTIFGCGDVDVTIPVRETAGGRALGADYEIKLLEFNDGFARRVTGKASNITMEANSTGTITISDRFVCIEYSSTVPPRADVALNFGGLATGSVSQVRGVGPLTVIE